MSDSTTIDETEEYGRDWDWFAVDREGFVGHFTSGGVRRLPNSVRQDRERVEFLDHYFSEEAPAIGGWFPAPNVEDEVGPFKDEAARRWFFESFAEVACCGAYSYNTELRPGKGEDYYLVAMPQQPLKLEEVPEAVQHLLIQTLAPLSFRERVRIPANETLAW